MLVRTPYAVARLRSSQYWPGDFTDERSRSGLVIMPSFQITFG
jgi:hypothetical protein